MPAWFENLQKELDGIIQDGVHNITKLIKISETHKLLNLQNLSAEPVLFVRCKEPEQKGIGPQSCGE